jgi:hypothetical protein
VVTVATKTRRVLSSDEYHICVRITWEYMEQIWKGTKKVEYRPPSEFWNTRCSQAKKFLKAGKDVDAILLCGKKSITVRVIACGLVVTGPRFWDMFSLGTVSQAWTPCSVWAIILGEVISSKGLEP